MGKRNLFAKKIRPIKSRTYLPNESRTLKIEWAKLDLGRIGRRQMNNTIRNTIVSVTQLMLETQCNLLPNLSHQHLVQGESQKLIAMVP